MSALVNVRSYLAPLPTSTPKDMIAFKAPTALLCIPLPPWSSLKNLDETSGLVEAEPANWISLDEDLGIDTYNHFQLRPRKEPIDGRQSFYSVGIGPFAKVNLLGKQIMEGTDSSDMTFGVEMFQDPFGRALVSVQVYCEISTEFGLTLSSHTELCPKFDIEDETDWPISRKTLAERLSRVRRIEVHPLTPTEDWTY